MKAFLQSKVLLFSVTALVIVGSGCEGRAPPPPPPLSPSTSNSPSTSTSATPIQTNVSPSANGSKIAPKATAANVTKVNGFGVIREFGGTDTAALFGLTTDAGSLQITGISAPPFVSTVGYGVGLLYPGLISHLFLKSSNPMSDQEKKDLVAKYAGASVIYIEGYADQFCTSNDTEYEIQVVGNLDGKPFTATLQFIALPNASGDCRYHTFFTMSSDNV